MQRTVVGMLLVDPAIPDQDAVRERVAPKFAAFGSGAPRAEAMRLRQCAAELRSGALKRGTPRYDECTAPSLLPSASALTKALAQLNADPARLLTQASAIENVSQSGREVINPQRRYGEMPLIVLTSGSHPMPTDVPADVREQAAAVFPGSSRLGMTPTLRYPRAVTTSSFRMPGTLSRSTIPRWFSRRSMAS